MKRKWLFTILIVIALIIIGTLYLNINSNRNKNKNSIEHIFLITIDTLRADHLSCYGYPRETTPFIDKLSQQGVLFKNAYSSSATTAPALATLFTSYYPITHKVQKNWFQLDENFETMAEILKKHGYFSAAFTSSWIFSPCRLDQGFEFFDEAPIKQAAIDQWGKKYRSSELTFKAIKTFFDSKNLSNRKIFVWIHLFDPHRPYYPPEEYQNAILNLKDKSKMLEFWQQVHKIDPGLYKNEAYKNVEHSHFFQNNPNYFSTLKAEDIMFEQINLYDAEIMYTDDTLKKIYEYFSDKGLNKKSLWIITGDHGEGLGNHNWFAHALKINTEAIKIPLIIWYQGENQRPAVEHVVEHCDILPTVTDLLGLNVNHYAKYSPGASLKRFITGKGDPYTKTYSFSQREYYKNRPNWAGKKLPDFLVYEPGDTYSLQNEKFQYIFRTEGENEFYNLQEDPYGCKNLAMEKVSSHKKQRFTFLNALKEVIRQYRSLTTKIKKATEKDINRIKTLGYVE